MAQSKWQQNRTKMSRLIFSALVVATVLAVQVALASIDVSQYENVRVEFHGGDSEHNTRLNYPEERGPIFIGDLTIGKHYADETVFRRVIDFNNPTDTIQSTTLDVSITDGSIHYISVRNTQGSYAVVCNNPKALGGNSASLNLRLPSNSKATLTLIIAAHNYAARSSMKH